MLLLICGALPDLSLALLKLEQQWSDTHPQNICQAFLFILQFVFCCFKFYVLAKKSRVTFLDQIRNKSPLFCAT
jgi:hypothetical protein